MKTAAHFCCRFALCFVLLNASALTWAQETGGSGPPKKLDALGDPLPAGAVVRLGTERLVHAGVRSIQFAPGGDMLATAGGLRVALWDVKSGRLLREWSMPQADEQQRWTEFGQVAFSPED